MRNRRPLTFIIDDNNCFIVTSHKPNFYGYPRGTVCPQGKSAGFNRIIFEICFGPIPEDLILRHTCDNRMCINPEHLLLGTRHDNMTDMVMRGRQSRGEQLPHTKLTSAQVKEIFLSSEHNYILAERFNISRPSISRIRNGYGWRHITWPLIQQRQS